MAGSRPALPTVKHSTLGTTFTGVSHIEGTNQFRGIKFGHVQRRFRKAVLWTRYGEEVDATLHGPIAPQRKSKGAEEELFGLDEAQIPRHRYTMDEFECLNLVITVPKDAGPTSNLPVMLWFHGGGNTSGLGSGWLYDGGHLVSRSVNIGKPVIMVAANYRLGLFGFAASIEIAADNQHNRDAGAGNYGLHDQELAIEWVHYFISSFGGDPHNITIFGESAGGWDVHSHCLSSSTQSRRLFARAIIQSGCVTSTQPGIGEQTKQLVKIKKRLGVNTLEQLRKVEPKKLVEALGTKGVKLTDDGVFFRYGWRNLAFPDGPKEIMIGDCGFESAIFEKEVRGWTTEKVVPFMRGLLSKDNAEKVMSAYGIREGVSDKQVQDGVLDFMNDIWFAYPTDLAIRGARKGGATVYQYLYDQQSPFTGTAHHAVDLIYLFGNVPLDASNGNITVRDATQDKWILFANGEQPWDRKKAFSFGPDGVVGDVGEEEGETFGKRRRRKIWREVLDGVPLEELERCSLLLTAGPGILKAKM